MGRPDLVIRNTTHGMANTRVYSIYHDMRKRCTNVKHKDYRLYGGRGIKICDRWMTFENFYEDMGDPPSKSHSIDRIDNDGDYTPENCVWASSYEQAQNKRSNKMITYRGQTKVLVTWTRELGIDYSRTKARLYLGWSVENAFESELYRRIN